MNFSFLLSADISVDIGDGDLGGSMRNNDDTLHQIADGLNRFIQTYKGIIVGVLGVALLTVFLIFMFTCMTFSGSSGTPMDRKRSVTKLVTCAIVAAILGSITLFVGLFYNIF